MIHLVCPGCGVKIKAKLELAGKTRKCPKCGGKIVVPMADGPPQAGKVSPEAAASTAGGNGSPKPVEIIQANPAESRLPTLELPERLNRRHRYLICDKTSIFATWQDNGQGWMVRGASGFVSARRNAENLPAYGQFTLIELEVELTDDGLRLAAITSYKLASRYTMTKLAIGDDDVLRAVTSPGSLNREQKTAVRLSLESQFMREVWADSSEVVEYLGNADYHSSSSRASDS